MTQPGNDDLEHQEESSGGGSWLVSYADLMTLLFAAFVVLYGTIIEGTTKTTLGVLAAIREAFVEVPDIIKHDDLVSDIKSGQFHFKAYFGETIERDATEKAVIRQDPLVAVDRDKARIETLLDQIATDREGIDMNLRKAMVAEENERGLTITLSGAYFFRPGSYRLSRDGRTRLTTLGELLSKLSRPMLIEGHSDNFPAPKPLDNEVLSALRAAESMHVLVDEVGISPLLIRTQGYGTRRPIVKTPRGSRQRPSAQDLAKNRRIEIKLFPIASSL